MATILALVPDLMFGTRLQETARHMDLTVAFLPAGADAAVEIARLSPSLVVVALDAPGAMNTITIAKQARVRVLAFGSHKDTAALAAARAAGADQVIARSRMAADLPNLLRDPE